MADWGHPLYPQRDRQDHAKKSRPSRITSSALRATIGDNGSWLVMAIRSDWLSLQAG
jgi:hypothetical protein